MGESTLVMLAKNMEEGKLRFPLFLSEKIDGIAYTIFKLGGKMFHVSRQNKPLQSIQHVVNEAERYLSNGDRLVGELYIPEMDFKDSGGIIRRHRPDERIRFGVYDCIFGHDKHMPFSERYAKSQMKFADRAYLHSLRQELTPQVRAKEYDVNEYPVIAWLGQYEVLTPSDLPPIKQMLQDTTIQPTFEGWMYRSAEHLFVSGKRSWGMARETMQGSIDLRVVSVEEAISKTGEPLGRVGRINVHYPHKQGRNYKDQIGVGPGKLTHLKAAIMWNNREQWIAGRPIIEIKFKIDPSYAALRQPTYQAWRRDKDVGDNE